MIDFLFQSCSFKQTLYIDKTAAGNDNFELTLASCFTEAAGQMSELFTKDTEKQNTRKGIIDIGQIREDFSRDESMVLNNLESPSENLL